MRRALAIPETVDVAPVAANPPAKTTAGRTPRWKALLVVLIASVQVGVPTVVFLGGDPPQRFGWHMFAAGSAPTVRIIDGDGRRRAVDLPPLASERHELDYSVVLPGVVCAEHSDAVAVVVSTDVPGRARTTKC